MVIYGCIPFFCLLILAGRHIPWLETKSGARLASFFGLLSFPVYVFHVQVIDLVAPLLATGWSGLSKSTVFLTLAVGVFILCSGAGALLESYLLAERARFLKRMQRGQADR
jgi:peptidoglycan/LPS O-acetylase OafA/YrhL